MLENFFQFPPSPRFTVMIAFMDLVKETGDMAGQHEVIAEDLYSGVVHSVSDLVKELKEKRKQVRCRT